MGGQPQAPQEKLSPNPSATPFAPRHPGPHPCAQTLNFSLSPPGGLCLVTRILPSQRGRRRRPALGHLGHPQTPLAALCSPRPVPLPARPGSCALDPGLPGRTLVASVTQHQRMCSEMVHFLKMRHFHVLERALKIAVRVQAPFCSLADFSFCENPIMKLYIETVFSLILSLFAKPRTFLRQRGVRLWSLPLRVPAQPRMPVPRMPVPRMPRPRMPVPRMSRPLAAAWEPTSSESQLHVTLRGRERGSRRGASNRACRAADSARGQQGAAGTGAQRAARRRGGCGGPCQPRGPGARGAPFPECRVSVSGVRWRDPLARESALAVAGTQ